MRDPEAQVRLEGFHAVKHALRFGAEVTDLVTPDRVALDALVSELAPDLAGRLGPHDVDAITADAWERLVGRRGLPSPLLGRADRRSATLTEVADRDGRVVVLEDPSHGGNVGAVVRVAAAAGAAAVVVVGDLDPWRADVLRGAAGLHFALPVARASSVAEVTEALRRSDRPVVALDERGRTEVTAGLPSDAVLLLGTERHGLTEAARSAADLTARIPMRDGVSSLNLAVAAGVALYAPTT